MLLLGLLSPAFVLIWQHLHHISAASGLLYLPGVHLLVPISSISASISNIRTSVRGVSGHYKLQISCL
ncbi:MAG: hypothetical protein WBP45_12785 [Daejeonella sp.]